VCSSDLNNDTDIIQFAIMAVIQLKHLHHFFESIPLSKGLFFRFILNLNQPQVAVTVGANKVMSQTSTNISTGGICPIMVASATANNGGSSFAVGALNVSLAVGNRATWTVHGAGVVNAPFTQSVNLYIPAYTMDPTFEQAYLNNPVKRIVYSDIYQYSIDNIAAGANVNQLISNGIAGLKSVLVIPFYTATANGGVLPYQSVFDPAGAGPTSPLVQLNNFNVVISGQNMLYNSQRYSFENFMNNLFGVNSVNGGLTQGLCSGLIGQLDHEMEYCYYYVDCSRMLPVEEPVPKSVSVQFQNQSARAISCIVFCNYGCEISIDVLSGSRV